MSDTFNHKKMRLLKTAIIERKKELGIGTPGIGMPLEGFKDDLLMDTWFEFWKGPRRHGNKRKSVAKDKVKTRRRERKRLGEEIE